jgi:regulatory protein
MAAARAGASAIELAYRYLGKRERTVAEVRARLQRAELPTGEIEEALAELQQLGYVDDARYARMLVQDKRALEGWGRLRIVRTLRQHGVAEQVIEAALAAEDGERGDDEVERALEVLERRFPAGLLDPSDRRRAFGVLTRKGYAGESAAAALRRFSRGGD